MTNETKIALFQQMLDLEHKGELQSEGKLFDNVDYIAESNGAYKMFEILGIESEYIKWSFGK